MKFLDVIIIMGLIAALCFGLYFLWSNLPPTASVEFESYKNNISENTPAKSVQFYPNMRYEDKEISYSLSPNCTNKKRTDATNAFELLQSKTVLSFYESTGDPEIIILCSNIIPQAEEKNHFVAGEGGPVKIINTSSYSVILTGKVSLYSPEKCDEPKVSTHEILHALGFDHNNNKESIMYPITDCNQEIDRYIIDEINNLYKEPSLPDLEIESITANKTGKYLNFKATIANNGLKESKNSSLEVIVNNNVIKTFQLGMFDVGTIQYLTITNLQISSDADTINLIIKTSEAELSKDNNKATIRAIKPKQG
ncbi:MAG: matrixin family metalloprotease [Nanoarchaeota archaeon]|nr:matrixin family metalloprotease [Nanoarchaeota archaeon]